MLTKTEITEDELVTSLKNGDTEAFSLLYDNYSNALLGVVYRIVDDKEAAEDILQEVFVKIWQKISQYDRSKGKLFTWLINIARNAAIDSTRVKGYATKSKIQSIDNSVRSINKQYNVSTQVDHIGLRNIVEKMKPEFRVLIDKLYFEGYTQEEAAEELNMPLGTVKTRIRAAISELRDLMK
ncbi:MAG TPA: sigma-70 family RNA polymerase sigma factor [Bacteroidia bacterium]|nr:sigma-70 family RNA polymerase sigma factor [Bacteroidia bacterium]